MCVIIFSGMKPKLTVEMWMDIFVEVDGKVSDKYYYINNMGNKKDNPCVPSCTCNGNGLSTYVDGVPKVL